MTSRGDCRCFVERWHVVVRLAFIVVALHQGSAQAATFDSNAPSNLPEWRVVSLPDHPVRFVYVVDPARFQGEVDTNGDILLGASHDQPRYQVENLERNHIRVKVDVESAQGNPVLFRMTAPRLRDADGALSEPNAVEARVGPGGIVLAPSLEWMAGHAFPISWVSAVEPVPDTRETLELGDPSAEDFRPKMTLGRWGEEASVSLEYETGEPGTARYSDGRLEWRSAGDVGVDITLMTTNFGGAELDLVLKRNPGTDTFHFRLDWQNLEFLYQPPLNEDPVPQADSCSETRCFRNGQLVAERPENVVGSYAVYLRDRVSGDYRAVGGKNYRAGKAFHIFRPKVIDAADNWVWARLDVDAPAHRLTVSVPAGFLDRAVYPVRVDPTFGYAQVGANKFSGDKVLWVDRAATSPTSNGRLASISFYGRTNSGAPAVNPGIFSDLNNRPYKQLACLDSGGTPLGSGYAWVTTSLAYSGLLAGTQYWLGVNYGNGSSVDTYYDTGPKSDTVYFEDAVAPYRWPDPWPLTPGNFADFRGGIYGTYITLPVVTTNAASGATSSAAALNGQANPGGVSTTGWFRYSINAPAGCSDSFGTRVPTASGSDLGAGDGPVPFSQLLASLAPSTLYYYCALASNSMGTKFGNVLSFTTVALDAGFDAGLDAGGSSSGTGDGGDSVVGPGLLSYRAQACGCTQSGAGWFALLPLILPLARFRARQ